MSDPTKPTLPPIDLAGVCDSLIAVIGATRALADALAAAEHWKATWAASPPAEPAPDLHAAFVVALVASTGLTAREVTAEGRTAYSVGVSFDSQDAMHEFYRAAAALLPPPPNPPWLEEWLARARAL